MDSSGLSAETRFRLLLEISQKISGTLDLDSVLDQILESLQSAVPYDAAGVFVLNRSARPLGRAHATNFIAGVALRGFSRVPNPNDPMLRAGKGIVGHVIRTGESIIAPDVNADPRYIQGRQGTRSEIAVPIIIGDQVIGALNLESDRPASFTSSDLEILSFFAASAALSIEKAILHQQVVDKKRTESQLRIAHEVQAGLLPASPPRLAGYDIAAVHIPTFDIGGDYYDYIKLPGARLGIAIADVAGKGVPAALIMATFRAALRSQLERAPDPVASMNAVNSMLLDSIIDSKFVTALYGILDPASGQFRYANCGHNPPLVVRTDASIERPAGGGLPLGILEEAELSACTLTLNPGDFLALYTDGVVDVTNAAGVPFEAEELARTLSAASAHPAIEMIESVIQATRAFADSDLYQDDFTLMVVKRAAP